MSITETIASTAGSRNALQSEWKRKVTICLVWIDCLEGGVEEGKWVSYFAWLDVEVLEIEEGSDSKVLRKEENDSWDNTFNVYYQKTSVEGDTFSFLIACSWDRRCW